MQESLQLNDTRTRNVANNLPETFQRLYYHLYTNSNASRADTIIEDLSLILLCKLAVDKNGNGEAIEAFLASSESANTALLPMLHKAYPALLDREQRFALGDSALRTAIDSLSDVQLAHAPAHTIGEAFQSLIGPRLRGERGQFFTPRSLVAAMVEIVAPKAGELILDPACGTGGFLAEVAIRLQLGESTDDGKTSLVGIDKDKGLARLASAMLRIIAGAAAQVSNFNSLNSPQWQAHLGFPFNNRFDVVLTNPPFGARIGVEDDTILGQYDFGHIWGNDKLGNWHKSQVTSKSQDPQTLFLELCVQALKPGGRMGIVLPEGMFGNKKSSYIWDWLEARGQILALLDCPRTTFQPGTDTKTNVLFFKKSRADGLNRGPRANVTKVAVAMHCGHDRRGRNLNANGKAHLDDFPELAKSFHKNRTQGSKWHKVDLTGQRYLVPRYFAPLSSNLGSDADILRGAKFITLRELEQQGLITLRKGHEVGSEAYGTGDISFVRTSDISNFEVSCDPTKSVSEEIYQQYRFQQNLTPGDILVVVDGRYRIGATALLTANNVRCVVQSHMRIIGTPNQQELGPYELLFALSLTSVKERIRNLVFIQSTLGTLGSRLLELEVPLLAGDGPWRESVQRFQAALQRRDQLLAELNSIAVQDVEL